MVNGHYEPGFEPIAHVLDRHIEARGGGAAVCVYCDGARVVDLWGGVRDQHGAPWQRNTMCVSYSTTKGVVATALHMLVDRGLLDYDDPVAAHWPEFGQAGKSSITVRDVLSHRAGLFNIRDLIDHADRLLDWDHMTGALAAAGPAPVPDGATAYHALTWGHVVGELIRRVSGMSVPAFLAREIAAPLGLDGLYVGAPADQVHRAARLVSGRSRRDPAAPRRDATGRPSPRQQRQRRIYQAAERALHMLGHPVELDRVRAALAPRGISGLDFSSPRVLRACIPAANGLFTARSLARLYATLAAGGALDGVRLLSPDTLARATAIQSSGYDQIILFKMRWRLGYHRVTTLRGVPRRAFGHFGWGGSGAWADPSRNISLAFIVNTGTGTPIGDLRLLQLNTALLRCLRTRSRGRAVCAWRRARD